MLRALVIGSYHPAQLKSLSCRGDAVGEYHQDLWPILWEMSGWQKQLPPPLSLEEGQTPQVKVAMEYVILQGVELDAFPEEN